MATATATEETLTLILVLLPGVQQGVGGVIGGGVQLQDGGGVGGPQLQGGGGAQHWAAAAVGAARASAPSANSSFSRGKGVLILATMPDRP